MIQYSKGLDADDEKIRIREESIHKPDFKKDHTEYIKKYEASREYVPRGYHYVPSGQGESLQLCGPFYRETEESERIRKEFEKKYPCFDYVAPHEAWKEWGAAMKKEMNTSENGNKQFMGCIASDNGKDSWKERLFVEYSDTKSRLEKLHSSNVRRKIGKSLHSCFEPTFSPDEVDLLERQEKVMREYLGILEMRMELANIVY